MFSRPLRSVRSSSLIGKLTAMRCSPILLLLLAACGGTPPQTIDITVAADGSSTTLAFAATATATIHYVAPGGLVELLVDCHPPETTDVRGFAFTATVPGYTTPERAGYWRYRADLAAGPSTLELVTDGGPATCTVSLTPAPSACGTLEVFRSVDTDHTHVAPATEPRADWETFPVSGNHYPVWAGWDRNYDLPIRTGYLLHDLEHGGIVLSFRCVNVQQSAECTTASADLTVARRLFAQHRTLLTPDPRQPALYAARAWRWGYAASCYDTTELQGFMQQRFRHGREDIDSDSAPFDPTQ